MNLLNPFFSLGWLSLHGLVVFLGLTIYAIASHSLRQRRNPSAAIAWVVSLILLPYVALPLYLVIGNRKVVSSRQTRSARRPEMATKPGQLAAAIGLPDIVSFEQLSIHQDGSHALNTLRSMIEGAERTIDLCSFLLGRDVLGDEIASLLMKRAREGVGIRLLLDGIGCYIGGHPNLKRLSAAGVHVALFVSPLQSALPGRTNLRNHRKMVIGDGQWLWCGGRNLAAEYFEGVASPFGEQHPWIDLSFDLHGQLAQQAQEQFDKDWTFATTGVMPESSSVVSARSTTASSHARLVPSGPDQMDDTIYTLLVSGCFTAHTRIVLVTPYFVPDPTLLMALTLAARRGIKLDLLLPRRSNHTLADIARQAALRELAAAGARVWLMPTMLHAKAILIDGDLALVGSANIDERSLFLNYELMVAFYDPSVVKRFEHWIEGHRSTAAGYHPDKPGIVRELVEGMVRWVAFQL